MRTRALSILLLTSAVSSERSCRKADVYDAAGLSWTIAGCSEIDLSCPPDGRAPTCENTLLPREVASLAAALKAELKAEGTGLSTLTLRGAPIGPGGLQTLAPSLRGLQSLQLGSARMGDLGLKAIVEARVVGRCGSQC